jgi:ubiquitin carboxyl-terminal hydrolase L5
MNIIMNVPELDIGDQLQDFKESTRNLKPPYRGKKLGADDFIRNIHNSFARWDSIHGVDTRKCITDFSCRKIDVLNADLALQNDYDKWVKSQKNPRRKPNTKQGKKKTKDEDEAGYHFVAYVPINGSVWRLDGLQREPENLGESKNWISTARDNIIGRIQQYENQGVEYNLMALTKSTLQTAVDQLAENLKTIIEILEKTAVHLPEINNIINQKIASDPPKMVAMIGAARSSGPEAVHRVFAQYGMTEAQVMSIPIPDGVQAMLQPNTPYPVEILQLYESIASQHNAFCASVEGESKEIGAEDALVEERKVDYAPNIYEVVNTLVENGVLKKIIKDLREQKSKWICAHSALMKGVNIIWRFRELASRWCKIIWYLCVILKRNIQDMLATRMALMALFKCSTVFSRDIYKS